jgi:hypothetical protein
MVLMQRQLTRVGLPGSPTPPDAGVAERPAHAGVAELPASTDAGSKRPPGEPSVGEPGFGQAKKRALNAPEGSAAVAALSPIFPDAVRVLLVHKTLWCNCEDCNAAQKLVGANCGGEGGGVLKHQVVDSARGPGKEGKMRDMLTSRNPMVIIAIHPAAHAGTQARPVSETVHQNQSHRATSALNSNP